MMSDEDEWYYDEEADTQYRICEKHNEHYIHNHCCLICEPNYQKVGLNDYNRVDNYNGYGPFEWLIVGDRFDIQYCQGLVEIFDKELSTRESHNNRDIKADQVLAFKFDKFPFPKDITTEELERRLEKLMVLK